MSFALQKRTINVKKRKAHSGQLRINSLESLNAPPDVVDFFNNMDKIKVTPVDSEAGKLRDMYGVKWTAQNIRKFMKKT
jgi:hypothetical protein